MEKLVFLFSLLIYSTTSFSFYLNTNIGAAFADKEVAIYVTSNSTCTNAGIDPNELLNLAVDGAKKYWNAVPTANLILKKGGVLQTTDSLFVTGKLCAADSETTCPVATSVPSVTSIVIACNNNSTDNFPSDEFLAISAPIHLSSSKIKGSVILINDTATSRFNTLSNNQIMNIMAHELGHAIGLGHTDKSEALMYHEDNEDRRKLAQDDIDGISYLYPNQFDGCKSIFGLSTLIAPKDPPYPGLFLLSLSIGFFGILRLVKFTKWLLLTGRYQTN